VSIFGVMIEVNSPVFWDKQYKNGNDRWNLNNAVPVFVQLLEEEKFITPSKLLILGSGKGYEAIFAAKKGYEVSAIDFSSEAINFSKNLAKDNNVKINFLQEDFFDLASLHPGEFDYIFEYVSICAVQPEKRKELLENIHAALKPGGRFISLLFPLNERRGGPPFSINLPEFYTMAKSIFKPSYFSRVIPSIKPRKNNEVLLIFTKGSNGKKS